MTRRWDESLTGSLVSLFLFLLLIQCCVPTTQRPDAAGAQELTAGLVGEAASFW